MVKHTQTIRLQQPTNSLSASDHFVGLAVKGLTINLARSNFHVLMKLFGNAYLKRKERFRKEN